MKKKLVLGLKLILIGIIIGLLIALFQFLAHEVIHLSEVLLRKELWVFFITIFCSGLIFIALYLINKKFPGHYGSGIPQIEAYHHGWYNFSPYKMFIFIFINSLFAFFSGFLLGSEGPSISIGSSVGMATDKNDKELVAAGGSAGFACAFASPLAGLCHLFEENKKIFSVSLLIKGIIIIGVSFVISYLVYPHSLLPEFDMNHLPLKYYLVLIGVIISCIMFSKIYMYAIIKIKDLTKKNSFMLYGSLLLLVGFMCLRRFYPVLIGNGLSSLEENIINLSLLVILGILLFRIICTALSVSSYVSGGVVLPMLAVGALGADFVIKIYAIFDSNILNYLSIFIVCGMFIVFTIVTNAPITAIILGLKCGPIEVIIIPIVLSVIISKIVYFKLKWVNIYHQLEKRLPGYID